MRLPAPSPWAPPARGRGTAGPRWGDGHRRVLSASPLLPQPHDPDPATVAGALAQAPTRPGGTGHWHGKGRGMHGVCNCIASSAGFPSRGLPCSHIPVCCLTRAGHGMKVQVSFLKSAPISPLCAHSPQAAQILEKPVSPGVISAAPVPGNAARLHMRPFPRLGRTRAEGQHGHGQPGVSQSSSPRS